MNPGVPICGLPPLEHLALGNHLPPSPFPPGWGGAAQERARKTFLLYHRSGFHFPQVQVELCTRPRFFPNVHLMGSPLPDGRSRLIWSVRWGCDRGVSGHATSVVGGPFPRNSDVSHFWMVSPRCVVSTPLFWCIVFWVAPQIFLRNITPKGSHRRFDGQ